MAQDVREFAPAKINLHLHVTGRRDDGYHLLDSLVVFAGVGEWLTVAPADDLSLTITGPFAAGLAAEPDNLVLRAARALADLAGIRPTGALMLEKNLPVASGVGGGSADAAAALRLLSRFWGVSLALDALAPRLGADVPVCCWAGRRGCPGSAKSWSRHRSSPRPDLCWSIQGWRFRPRRCSARDPVNFPQRPIFPSKAGPTPSSWREAWRPHATTLNHPRGLWPPSSAMHSAPWAVAAIACWPA